MKKSTQSEAIRLALFWFAESKLNEDELAAKKMEKIHKEIKKGKRKVYTLDEMIKTHPEYKILKWKITQKKAKIKLIFNKQGPFKQKILFLTPLKTIIM